MKVLIVAKTRMGGGACIGAITEQGESVRLVPFDADPHDGANLEYNVGNIWEISSEPATSLIPPHNENIVVYEKEHLLSVRELVSAIELLMPSRSGGQTRFMEGCCKTPGENRFSSPSGAVFHLTAQRFGDQIRRSPAIRREGGCGIVIPLKMVGARSPLPVFKNHLKLFPQARSSASH